MKDIHILQDFIAVLDRQTALINELSELELELQTIVADRNWERLSMVVPKMTAVSDAINESEEIRAEMVRDLSRMAGPGMLFSELLRRLPTEARVAVTERYRNLKVAMLRLRSRSSNIDSYLRATISTQRGVLKELYPDRTSPGYSSSGDGTLNAAPAMVLDHTL